MEGETAVHASTQAMLGLVASDAEAYAMAEAGIAAGRMTREQVYAVLPQTNDRMPAGTRVPDAAWRLPAHSGDGRAGRTLADAADGAGAPGGQPLVLNFGSVS